MHKILLAGSFHGNNKGDELIFVCFKNFLGENYPNNESYVTTINPHKFSERYGVFGVDPRNVFNVFKLIKNDIDIIILAGGGTFIDYNILDTFRIKGTSQLIYWLSISLLGKIFKKKVLWIALGAGPIKNKITYRLIRLVGNKVDFISFRDPYSVKLIKRHCLLRIKETRDIVYTYDRKLKTTRKKKYALLIPRKTDNGVIDEKVLSIYFLISRILIDRGFDIIVYSTNYRADKSIIDLLSLALEKLPNSKITVIKNDQDGIENFVELVSSSKLIVSMRMHPVILGSLSFIPSYCLSYDSKKMYYCLKDFGNEKYCLDINKKSLYIIKSFDTFLNE